MGINIFVGAVVFSVLTGYSAFFPPFISQERGLVYNREIGQRQTSVLFLDSAPGMNKFSERDAKKERVLSAAFLALNYLRFDFCLKERMAHESGSVSRVYNSRRFSPLQPERPMVRGMALDDLTVSVFAFSVTNNLSDIPLECSLVKFHKDRTFVFAVYCNENDGKSDFVFSGIVNALTAELVLSESAFPYLNAAEALIQKEFCEYASGILHPETKEARREKLRIYGESLSITNDVEVSVDNL